MPKASISELKSRLSAYLRRVRAGEIVHVYDRDRPVARIERLDEPEIGDARLARLVARGVVRPATGPIPIEPLSAPPPRPSRSASAALIAERAEGR